MASTDVSAAFALYKTGQTAVIVSTTRGREDEVQVVHGAGGIGAGNLHKINLVPAGRTFIWEPLMDFLAKLAEAHKAKQGLPSARIINFDLSQSMASKRDILKRMWASIPPSDVTVDGVELMVVTDGHDNDSEGDFSGISGLSTIIQRGRALGFDFGDGHDGDLVAKVSIILLDVSAEGTIANELKHSTAGTVLHTQDVEMVARVVRQTRPANLRRHYKSNEIADAWEAIPDPELARIKSVEKHIGKARDITNVQSLFDARIKPIADISARNEAYNQVVMMLGKLMAGESAVVLRRGEKKNRSHSEINSVLYALKGWGALDCDEKASPRVWTRGVMYQHLMEQLEALHLPVTPLAIDDTAGAFTALSAADMDTEVKALSREDLEKLVVQLAKRQRVV